MSRGAIIAYVYDCINPQGTHFSSDLCNPLTPFFGAHAVLSNIKVQIPYPSLA